MYDRDDYSLSNLSRSHEGGLDAFAELYLEAKVSRNREQMPHSIPVLHALEVMTCRTGPEHRECELAHYSWFIRCCTLSFTVKYALINVCSLITISVVSALGRLTRDAIAVESVSTITLEAGTVSNGALGY